MWNIFLCRAGREEVATDWQTESNFAAVWLRAQRTRFAGERCVINSVIFIENLADLLITHVSSFS